jgi:DNA modification methylase
MTTIKIPRPLFEATNAVTKKRRRELKAEVAASALAAPNDLQPTLVVTMWPIDALRPPEVNAREEDAEHVAGVQDSMAIFANVQPILICSDPMSPGEPATAEILDGVIRWRALKAHGATQAACIELKVPPGKREALRIRLNAEQEQGGWALEPLGKILIDLKDRGWLGAVGLKNPVIDMAMTRGGATLRIGGQERAEDQVPAPGAATTRRGDLFALGPHRLFCGDALDGASHAALLGDTKLKLIVTDEPWNVSSKRIGSRGKIKHADFAQAAGEMSDEEFAAFCRNFIALMMRHALAGTLVYIFVDWAHLVTLIGAATANGLIQKDLIVWDKGRGGLGGLYRSSYELLPLFAVPGAASTDNVKLGRHGRDRGNIFRYPGAGTKGSSAQRELQNHPTPKSVELIADIMLDASEINDPVLDVFAGSGTVFVAAQRTHRVAYGIEISPAYCDVAIRRWERESGQPARLIATGESFADLTARRATEHAAEAALDPATEAAEAEAEASEEAHGAAEAEAEAAAGPVTLTGNVSAPDRPRIRVKAASGPSAPAPEDAS